MQAISIGQLEEKRTGNQPLQLVDVRSGGEFAAGHIPGAINIPLEQLAVRQADLATEGSLVLICQSGRRARMAAESLASLGVTVSVLEGGTAAWLKQERPFVKANRSAWSIERQIRLAAGLLVVTGGALGIAVDGGWNDLSLFVGAGLTFSGLTGTCGMGAVLQTMPWNKQLVSPMPKTSPKNFDCAGCK